MRSNIVSCLLSAAIGGIMVAVLYCRDSQPTTFAQDGAFAEETFAENRHSTPSARATAAQTGRVDHRPLPPGQRTQEELVNMAVYDYVHRSVVHINTQVRQVDRFLFLDYESEGTGAGSVIDRQGHILTNLHVVEEADRVEVTLYSGTSYPARLVGHDALHDVAILKIDATADELFPLPLGDSSALRVGQRVYAIGSPFELERTFTTGIISSTERTLPSRLRRRMMNSIIQVDAAMNPGNSGGPLVDTSAHLIGMNTAIASRSGENTGVGFAIPVNRIKRIVPDLIRYGKVTRPDLGITRVRQTEHGLLIRTLSPNGPAAQAGLKGFRVVRRQQGPLVIERIDPTAADLIVAVDGHDVKTLDDLESYVEDKKPGEQVVLTIVRQGYRRDVTVRLGQSR